MIDNPTRNHFLLAQALNELEQMLLDPFRDGAKRQALNMATGLCRERLAELATSARNTRQSFPPLNDGYWTEEIGSCWVEEKGAAEGSP